MRNMGKALEKRVCLHCGCTETPLWRSGPDGQKTLCNADGVRLKKGKLQLYLDSEGNVTANPGPGNKPFNTVAKRREFRRSTVRKPQEKVSGRVRKPVSRSTSEEHKVPVQVPSVGSTAGKRFTRGASRQNEELLNKVLAESKSLYDAKNNHPHKKGDPAPVSAISSVMKEVYGCLPSNESQLSLQTEDTYSVTGSFFDFENLESFSEEPNPALDGDESMRGWDLHADLNEALSPLAASAVDGNTEPLAVNNAS